MGSLTDSLGQVGSTMLPPFLILNGLLDQIYFERKVLTSICEGLVIDVCGYF